MKDIESMARQAIGDQVDAAIRDVRADEIEGARHGARMVTAYMDELKAGGGLPLSEICILARSFAEQYWEVQFAVDAGDDGD